MSPGLYQMILVPVVPVLAQPIAPAAPGAAPEERYQPVPMVQLAWAQPVPGADCASTGPWPSAEQLCYAAPPRHGALWGDQRVGLVLDALSKAAGPVVAAADAESSVGGNCTPASTACGSWADADDTPGSWASRSSSKSSVESPWPSQPRPRTISAARRLRRQRAAERMGAFGERDAPEASEPEDSSGEASPSGAEGEATRAEATAQVAAKAAAKWVPKQQDLLDQLAAGGEAQRLAISHMMGSVWLLSREPLGCRAVQLALEQASRGEAEALVAELRGHVLEAIHSPHANYVVQKIIQSMPAQGASFVAEEVAGFAGRVARHRFGCRIFCRLLEQPCEEGSAAAALISECLEEAEGLCRHPFGHYVLKAILEHGTGAQRHRIAQAIRSGTKAAQAQGLANGLMRNALHRNAGYVLEKCLEHCSPEDRNALARELLDDRSMAALGQSLHAGHVVKARISHVVRAVLRVPDIEPAVLARLGALEAV